MKPACDQPETLLTVSPESDAASIATALAECQIESLTISSAAPFDTESSANVAVVVKRADFDRAKQAMADIQHQANDIDWSHVNVTETPEVPRMAIRVDSLLSYITMTIWWMLECMGITMGLIQWWYTGNLSNTLIYVFSILALIGLFLALFPFCDRRTKVRSFAISFN